MNAVSIMMGRHLFKCVPDGGTWTSEVGIQENLQLDEVLWMQSFPQFCLVGHNWWISSQSSETPESFIWKSPFWVTIISEEHWSIYDSVCNGQSRFYHIFSFSFQGNVIIPHFQYSLKRLYCTHTSKHIHVIQQRVMRGRYVYRILQRRNEPSCVYFFFWKY